ncbi:Hsp20/alpha crystallin family protein [Pseudanabaena sp. FACHB-1998]|uniref:Hsp20/alpha crystallin family protein n=1 Tax=Pseudanabaena sp. FACHB-1998 TaxID=2692858 RepID=UPI0016800E2D|nr:Hsp20/alpha crystallin family protein [Pseudanabaena sp. FACHB-1998]MBD2175529.1 Hsp20/alpha crystallin family protein [Pseudanabaena sp. FACHB-1998]
MLVRWQPFQEIEEVRRQFDRLFRDISTIDQETAKGAWVPASELRDDGDHLTLRLAIPDVDAKDLDIQVTKDSLAVSGERRLERKEENEKGYYWSEISYGQFRRVFALPVAIENEQVKADYTNGILTLTLPKANEVKAFKVNVATELPAS